jgi:hypothetical protein
VKAYVQEISEFEQVGRYIGFVDRESCQYVWQKVLFVEKDHVARVTKFTLARDSFVLPFASTVSVVRRVRL